MSFALISALVVIVYLWKFKRTHIRTVPSQSRAVTTEAIDKEMQVDIDKSSMPLVKFKETLEEKTKHEVAVQAEPEPDVMPQLRCSPNIRSIISSNEPSNEGTPVKMNRYYHSRFEKSGKPTSVVKMQGAYGEEEIQPFPQALNVEALEDINELNYGNPISRNAATMENSFATADSVKARRFPLIKPIES